MQQKVCPKLNSPKVFRLRPQKAFYSVTKYIDFDGLEIFLAEASKST